MVTRRGGLLTGTSMQDQPLRSTDRGKAEICENKDDFTLLHTTHNHTFVYNSRYFTQHLLNLWGQHLFPNVRRSSYFPVCSGSQAQCRPA